MPHPYKDLKEWSERCAALGLAEAPAVELPVQSGKGVEVRMRRNGPTGPLRGVPFDKAPGAMNRHEMSALRRRDGGLRLGSDRHASDGAPPGDVSLLPRHDGL
jgi:hypothetical protein